MSTMTSPGLTRSGPWLLMAAIAARSRVNTRAGPTFRYTPSASTTEGSIAVLLITEPCGARFPRGNVTVLVRPRTCARSGAMMTSSGSTPSMASNRSRSTRRRSEPSHQPRSRPSRSPATVRQSSSSRPLLRKWSMTSGTPPARNTRTVGWFRGPFGRTSTIRGTRRFTSIQSSTVGRLSPAACAMAVRCRSRLVEPPNAAWTVIAFRTAASVRICLVVTPRASRFTNARADRRAMSAQIGCPEGASAV